MLPLKNKFSSNFDSWLGWAGAGRKDGKGPLNLQDGGGPGPPCALPIIQPRPKIIIFLKSYGIIETLEKIETWDQDVQNDQIRARSHDSALNN